MIRQPGQNVHPIDDTDQQHDLQHLVLPVPVSLKQDHKDHCNRRDQSVDAKDDRKSDDQIRKDHPFP